MMDRRDQEAPRESTTPIKHARRLRRGQNPGEGRGGRRLQCSCMVTQANMQKHGIALQPEIKEEEHGGVHVKSRNEGPQRCAV